MAEIWKREEGETSSTPVTSDNPFPVQLKGGPLRITLQDRVGANTLTTGGTAQTVLPANPARNYLILQNTDSANLWYSFQGTAVAASPSLELTPGQALVMDVVVAINQLSLIGSLTPQKYSLFEG